MEGKPWLRGSATEVHGGVDGCTFMVGFRSWGVYGEGHWGYIILD